MIGDDEALVRAAQQGSLASFNQLVERYQTALYNFVLRHVFDPQLAEDVTQEAFLSAWRAVSSYKGGSFRAWLFRIAINEARDLHRRAHRRPSTSLDTMVAEGTLGSHEATGERGPEEQVVSSATMQSIEAALQKLPGDQRMVILLSDVQQMPYEEVAEALGLPLGTVKSRLFRGRVALRRLLVESGEL
ncbi:MAG: sigma-70 family RNA polymerase sigma factor [Chloroflexota bacterium]|nr:sigma-70 family RNA polymerase sigma factor [Chloroflexota bacterium]